jgi:hypothetical protein
MTPINAMTVEAIQKQFSAFIPNQFGLVQYSQTQYGRYDTEEEIFRHPLMQLRIRSGNSYVYTQVTAIFRPISLLRIRSGDGSWVYNQLIPYTRFHEKWRIRSNTSEWVYNQTISKGDEST